jgi:general secretion pathway protein D
MVVVILVLMAFAFLYVNASIYSFNGPLAGWTIKVLAKVGIQLSAVQQIQSGSKSPSTTKAAQAAAGRSADANRPSLPVVSLSNPPARQPNANEAGFRSFSADSNSPADSNRPRFGRGTRSRLSFDNRPEVFAQMRSRIPGDMDDPNRLAMMRRFADANESERFAMMRRFAGGDDPNRSMGFRRRFDPNEPNRPAGFRGGFGMGFGRAEPNEANQPPVDANTVMESLNLKDVQMKDVIAKIAEWTGKVIIPTDESMNQRLTIYSAKRLPRKQALSLIYAALRTKGFVAEEVDNVIYLKPIQEAMFGSVPLVSDKQPLAAIENKNQVVQKYFKLENYSPTNMSNVLLPMIGQHGYISADENARSLLIIDTVENLMRFERVIQQFDVPEAGQTTTRIFQVRNADPAEIVQILNILLGATSQTQSQSQRGRTVPFPFGTPAGATGAAAQRPGSATGAARSAASVVISPSNVPVTLVPEQKQKWIIAKGPPETLDQIGEWITQFDIKDRVTPDFETIPIKYADATEVADRINTALQKLPGSELKSSVLVQPLKQAKQIMVFGSTEMRDLVKKLIDEVDVIPSSELKTRTFKLKYADPEQIKSNIDSLYSGVSSSDLYSSYMRSSSSSQRSPADEVKAIAFPTTQEVTVIASEQNLAKIEEQIKEWDVPLDTEALKPRIIELRNTDPVQMADLLSKLFSESSSSQAALTQYTLGSRTTSAQQAQKKVVGALYGQLTFESVPGTKKIIVISKVPEAYRVIEQLIADLDKEEMAEVPEVVVLKYADPEDLAIRLNAIFNEPGVAAPIWFKETGLSAYSMTTGTAASTSTSTGTSTTSGQQQMTGQGDYTPPWSRSPRSTTTTEQMPISNAIGRVRIIPDPHSKSLLVLAPPEFMTKLIEMITKLDQPGKQVMIKAVILEVDHSSMTSLGMQLASNPSAFGTLNENSITALNALTQLERNGSALFSSSITPTGTTISTTADALGNQTQNAVTSNITVLIDFLVKTVNAKILNQQTLWTKDNEEATLFKGDDVAFLTGTSTTGTGGVASQSYEFNRVGMVLRARPNITPEKNVDMIVNVILSQLTSELVNGQPKRNEMETQTNMIVQDGQTIMLGGILFQQDSLINRKLPLVGDIPLVGQLFQHNVTQIGNNELIVFITPYVIDTETTAKTQKELEGAQNKMQEVLKSLKSSIEKSDLK